MISKNQSLISTNPTLTARPRQEKPDLRQRTEEKISMFQKYKNLEHGDSLSFLSTDGLIYFSTSYIQEQHTYEHKQQINDLALDVLFMEEEYSSYE